LIALLLLVRKIDGSIALQNEVSVLSPRVAFLDQQRTILTVGNSHLKQRIAALAQDKIFKDGEYHALLGVGDHNLTSTAAQMVHNSWRES